MCWGRPGDRHEKYSTPANLRTVQFCSLSHSWRAVIALSPAPPAGSRVTLRGRETRNEELLTPTNGSQAIQLLLECDLVLFRHDERSAAPHQIEVTPARPGDRIISHFPACSIVLEFERRRRSVCICQETSHSLAVPVINLHKIPRNSGTALSREADRSIQGSAMALWRL